MSQEGEFNAKKQLIFSCTETAHTPEIYGNPSNKPILLRARGVLSETYSTACICLPHFQVTSDCKAQAEGQVIFQLNVCQGRVQ